MSSRRLEGNASSQVIGSPMCILVSPLPTPIEGSDILGGGCILTSRHLFWIFSLKNCGDFNYNCYWSRWALISRSFQCLSWKTRSIVLAILLALWKHWHMWSCTLPREVERCSFRPWCGAAAVWRPKHAAGNKQTNKPVLVLFLLGNRLVPQMLLRLLGFF